MYSIAVASLVEFRPQPGTLGIVAAITGNVATVTWDEGVDLSSCVKLSSLTRYPLEHPVQHVNTGAISIRVQPNSDDTPSWRVTFPDEVCVVPERLLRPFQENDPISRIRRAEFAPYRKLKLVIATWNRYLGYLHQDMMTLAHTSVDLKPYQIGVAHRAISSHPHRFLLCDEVGLGKTIEAGMIVKELRARDIATRCLIICPPGLQQQWQYELKTKFNETFSVVNRDTLRYLQNQRSDPDDVFTIKDSVIVSSNWIVNEPQRSHIIDADWDMIIVDEAHHVRSKRIGNQIKTTQLYDLVAKLSERGKISTRALLLLTATPMQLQSHELYALVELCDPILFASERDFDNHRHEVRDLNNLVEQLREGFPIKGEAPPATAERIARLLRKTRQQVARQLTGSDTDRVEVCNELSRLHRLSEVLLRNRKRVVGEFMPRQAVRWPVKLSDEEHDALTLVEEYVQYGFGRADEPGKNAIGLLMTTFQKIMASSTYALRESLKKRRMKLRPDGGSGVPDSSIGAIDFSDSDGDDSYRVLETDNFDELNWLDLVIDELDTLSSDLKCIEFRKQMRLLFESDADAKVLIFTQYLHTQDYLAEHLRNLSVNGGPIGVHLFRGALDARNKDAAIELFRVSVGPQVLISTESGGEGRNLQFCHYLVNYDLPWNPMRVEQRIGRLDRIGQEHVVNVFNLYLEGTIEERVLDVLEHRIRLFEENVGALDPILGNVESELRDVLRREPELRNEALAEFGQQLEQQLTDARKAEEQLRDFIMDTQSYRKEIVERISNQPELSPEERAYFFRELIIDVNAWIEGPKDSGEYHITFHDPFLSDHKDILVGPILRAVFDPSLRRDRESVEYLGFGHPIIDAIRKKVLDGGHAGTVGAWALPEGRDLPPSQGWLFVFVLDTTGLEPRSDLLPVYVADDDDVSTEMGSALVKRAGFWKSEESEIELRDIRSDGLENARLLAETVVLRSQDDRMESAQASAAENLERGTQRVSEWFEQRERVAASKLTDVASTLHRLRASSESGDQQILPVWEAKYRDAKQLVAELPRERDQRIASLERDCMPAIGWRLVAAARIEIRRRRGRGEVGS